MLRVLFGPDDRERLGLDDKGLELDLSRLSAWEIAELERIDLDPELLGTALRERKGAALLAIGWLAARRARIANRIEAFDFDVLSMGILDDAEPGEGLGKSPAPDLSTQTSGATD